MRGGAVLLWSAAATVVLIALGVFGTLVATGRITLFPEPEPVASVVPTAEPVIDTSVKVTILNATPQEGLANSMGDAVIAAGWSPDDVTASAAGSQDFAQTSVFYSSAADEGAAHGLAQAIGGAELVLSDAYADLWGDPSVRQLVVVIGLDRTTGGAPSATP